MKLKKPRPDFSIVMATYNEDKYLPKCLESIKNQDFKGQVEIIVVDSFSTDKTVAVAKKYGAKVSYFPKTGPGTAKRKGCAKARGRLIAIIDGDSTMPSYWLRRAAQNLEDPAVSATGGPYIFKNLPKFFWPLNKFIYSLTLKILRLLPGGSIAFRKSDYLRVGGIPSRMGYGEDVGFSRRLAAIGKIKVDPQLFALESGRRVGIGKLFTGSYSYIKHTLKFLISKNEDELRKIRMKKLD